MKSALLITCLLGCSPVYGEEYIVHIQPSFKDHTDLVLEALDNWSDAVGVAVSPVIEEPIHCRDPGNICISIVDENFLNQKLGEEDSLWTGDTTRNTNDFASIYILDLILNPIPYDPIYNPHPWYAAQATIAHEFGHAFGLSHDTHSGSVMCADLNCGGTQISCWDKQQYFNLRGVNFYCH